MTITANQKATHYAGGGKSPSTYAIVDTAPVDKGPFRHPLSYVSAHGVPTDESRGTVTDSDPAAGHISAGIKAIKMVSL